MRKFITILAIAGLCAFGSTLSAQNNNGGGNGNNHTGLGNDQYPMSLVVNILQKAQPLLQSQTGLSLGQLIQKYRRCECTISGMGDGKTYEVRVEDGGGLGTVVIISIGS